MAFEKLCRNSERVQFQRKFCEVGSLVEQKETEGRNSEKREKFIRSFEKISGLFKVKEWACMREFLFKMHKNSKDKQIL